jgi:carboxyl-terminal processing protease
MNKFKIKSFKRFSKVFLILAGAIILASYTFCNRETKEQVLLILINNALKEIHYSPKDINDDLSVKVFNEYIKSLDFSKRFFTLADISQLQDNKLTIDDQISSGSLEFYKKTSTLFFTNVEKVRALYTEILSKPFDFTVNENYETDPEKVDYPADDNALKDRWRKSLKYQVLVKVSDVMKTQESLAADSVKKTFAQAEIEARNQLLKTHNEWLKRIRQNPDIDNYALFLNAIISVFDPHSQYLPPFDKENFDMSMSGQLEGIGALLQAEDGYIKIIDIIPGSPSWLQGELKVGDKIMKVAQENAEPIDIFDMHINDVVKMIRGKKGTKVTLTIKKHIDGSIKNITITRDVVIIEEQYAKSAIIENKEKIGYIFLPKFYANFEQTETGRTSAIDIANEINKLKSENVKGIVLDLRNNGGGSLQDAIRMAGLFIKEGPIVQVKTNKGPARVYPDPDKNILFDGGLVILVNSFSASASEILAAAMQDYKRAIIMGSNSTFGKGTVQSIYDLDDEINPSYGDYKPLGSLLITIQKFYRINGGATQLKGVIPDIIMPDPYSEIESGERDYDYSLPWTKIAAVPYEIQPNLQKFQPVIDAETKAIASDPNFKIIKEQALDIKKQRNQTLVTLNYEKYNKEEAEFQATRKKYNDLIKQTNGLTIKSLAVDENKIKNDTALVERTNRWLKDLKNDIYLKEAVKVVESIDTK